MKRTFSKQDGLCRARTSAARRLRVFADDILGQLDLKAQLLGQTLGNRREGILHVETRPWDGPDESTG